MADDVSPLPRRRATTASVRVVLALLGAAAARGLPAEELRAALGVSPEDLRDPEARVPHAVAVAAWDEVARRLGDPCLGLHLAQTAPTGAFGVMEYAMNHSATLREAFGKAVRYQRLIHSAALLRLEAKGGTARFTHDGRRDLQVPPHAVEWAMASLLSQGRRLSRVDWAPSLVRFQHAACGDGAEHARFFRAPVEFGCVLSEMVFDEAILALPISTSDPRLGQVLERHAEHLLADLPDESMFIEQVRRCVRDGMRGGAPAAAAVARKVGMSERSLHRRLQQEGATYQAVIDTIRGELATRQLRETQLSPTEIAFLLGFAEVGAFYRAFRRWTGSTPALYRRAHAA